MCFHAEIQLGRSSDFQRKLYDVAEMDGNPFRGAFFVCSLFLFIYFLRAKASVLLAPEWDDWFGVTMHVDIRLKSPTGSKDGKEGEEEVGQSGPSHSEWADKEGEREREQR